MDIKLKIIKGINDNDEKEYIFQNKDLNITDFNNPMFLSAKEIRNRLIKENFISTKNGSAWRFVFPYVEADEAGKISYSDRIVPISSEKYTPIKDLIKNINNENEQTVILTDTQKEGIPDLIGFETDYFNNGKIKVRCKLRYDKDEDKIINKDKFEPILLTDVISTREDDQGVYYKFACICCEDSVIEFPVESFGTVGMNLRAEVNNELIYNASFNWGPYVHDVYGHSSVNCMKDPDNQNKRKNITVKNILNDTSINHKDIIRYQKITIYTKDLLEWYDQTTKITYTKDSKPPKTITLNFAKSQSTNVLNSTKEEQIYLPSESVSPGEITAGSSVEYKCGKWNVKKISDTIMGSVSIYMFVFNSLEKAQKVIGRYNKLTEKNQIKFWENKK